MPDRPVTVSSPALSNPTPDEGNSQLHVEAARDAMLRLVSAIPDTQGIDLQGALGRVLATDVVSPIDVPAHDNSAMDGWALRSADLSERHEVEFREVGTALAGSPWQGSLSKGECVRIMTGAVMPEQCDTVVPQEYARPAADGRIVVPAGTVKAGDHRRLRGEDLAAGKVALPAGRVLLPADLGLLASLGIGTVTVRRCLRVAIFSTGDELRAPGQALEAGCIYDSNRYTLHGMLTRLGCEVIDLGAIKDEPALLEATLRQACVRADAVITSGGVSVGEADFTKQVMARLGDVTFWRIAMRPGRPMAFGRIASDGRQACLFGLPGNPVAVMVTFYFLVRPALLRMMGAVDEEPLPVRATAEHAIRKKPGRTEYQRAILSRDATGAPQVRITGSQGSGILRSMSQANCMVVLGHEQGNVAAGEAVDVVLFDGLV